MMLWLMTSIALGVDPVVEPVGSGRINWTTMELEVTSRSDRTVGAWKEIGVVEQDALDRLKPLIDDAARRVRYDPNRSADDLMAADETGAPPDVARRLDDGLASWRVRETRYLSNGAVEMDGVLELQRWLRPMLLTDNISIKVNKNLEGPTGVVVDARQQSFNPCLAPEIRTATGEILVHPSMVHPDVLRVRSPVLYVMDPADVKAVERAGDHPMFLTAAASERDCKLTVSASDSNRLINNIAFGNAVASGRVVLVVNP